MNNTTRIGLTCLLIAGLASGCGDDSAAGHLASAKAYVQQKDTKSAIIAVKNALQKDPELGEARLLLGSAFLRTGDDAGAEVELRKALAAGQPEELVVPELAQAMLALGQGKKVVDEFGSLRFSDAKADAALQTVLAEALGILGRREQAQTALANALAANPRHLPAVLLRTRQRLMDRDYDGALVTVEQAIAMQPGSPEAWKLKGDILQFAKNQPDEALLAYGRSLQAEPAFGPAHFAVLNLLLQQGRLEDVARQLDELKKFAANNPQTKYFEAQLAYQQQDFKKARELSQQLLQLAPNNAFVLYLTGAVELQLGAAAQAENYLSKAVRAAPDMVPARRLLTIALLRSGQPAKALEALKASTGKDGIDPTMYSVAGEVFLQNGDAKQAEEFFALAVKRDPANVETRTALAVAQLNGGQANFALGELQNIASADSGTTADLALISAHLRRQRYDEALAAVDKLEAKQPGQPLAAQLRGRIQMAKKDLGAARKSFELALQKDPSYFSATAGLAALDIAEKQPAAAKARFEALLVGNPKNSAALYALAQLAAVGGGSTDEAAGLLNRAIEASPTDGAPRLFLIEWLLAKQEPKRAMAAAQVGVAALPDNPALLAALGKVQLASGEGNQAIASYSKLVTMQPYSASPHLRMAEAQLAGKNKLGAEQSLRKALEIQPDDLEAQRALIALLVQAQKFQEAATVARAVQTQRPKEATGFIFAGDIQVARKDWSSATAAYRTAWELAPTPEPAIKLHTALQKSLKSAEADRFAADWLKAQPQDSAFLSHLGLSAIERKDYAAAEKYYLAVLKLQSTNAAAMNNLAWVLHQRRQPEALAHAERANALAPDEPSYMDTLAAILSDRGEHSKAITLQLKAVDKQRENGVLRLNLARIYLAAGDKAKAEAELDTLSRSGMNEPLTAEVIALRKKL